MRSSLAAARNTVGAAISAPAARTDQEIDGQFYISWSSHVSPAGLSVCLFGRLQ